ncbi:MAG: winged helix-turn-helix transcriptional regulator [Coriobacteriaceae bacterium]|nr:winged helix-turn-helix transcriptional regulator [Coriobacteriaceae bacterium]
MTLTRSQFKVLHALSKSADRLSQRTLAGLASLSLGTINKAVQELEKTGCLKDGRITPHGITVLEPFRVQNAIILAAGLSSRFAPISYERPKGVLKVKGEILIERQIRQLREAGIDKITVVVGYKKEYFFYLAAKYGVSIVVNSEYATKNNSWSLWLASSSLSNTYICSSDNYFVENPFERYVWKAYYATEFAHGATEEWCVTTGSANRITGITIGGNDSWIMLGHVYFDQAFSQAFKAILEQEISNPETDSKLWEDIFKDHLAELNMEARHYPSGQIKEFDSLDELRDFDESFIENVDSNIFDNISEVLGCDRSEIRNVYPLKQGLTNLSCHFTTDSGEWVYRHPGIGTELLIDRSAEHSALKLAKELSLDTTFLYMDAGRGWKISRFIPNARQLDPHDPVDLKRAMQICRELHATDRKVDRSFSFITETERYKSLLTEKAEIEIPDYRELSEKFDELAGFIEADQARVCLCHNDFFSLNFLIDQYDHYNLIDWEYAGMGDYANDFGTFAVCCQLDGSEVDQALEFYFERKPTPEEHRHNLALIAFAGWCWYNWSLLKEAEGDAVGEWLYIYYRYAVTYLDQSLNLYKGEVRR